MSLALQKGLPSNLDVERLVLGAVLLDDRVFVSVAAVLTPQDFSLEKHRASSGAWWNCRPAASASTGSR
jgi:hypothetical protein